MSGGDRATRYWLRNTNRKRLRRCVLAERDKSNRQEHADAEGRSRHRVLRWGKTPHVTKSRARVTGSVVNDRASRSWN